MGNEFPKHETGKPRKGAKKQPPATEPPAPSQPVVLTGSSETRSPSIQHDINYVNGLDGIESSLDWIAKGIESITRDDRAVSLTSGGCVPIKITLAANDEEDTMGDLVIAFQRIADSVAKLAGLDRPPLEPEWSRQAEQSEAPQEP